MRGCAKAIRLSQTDWLRFADNRLPPTRMTARPLRGCGARAHARGDLGFEDLREQLGGFSENFTVLEVGSYFGYTTRWLSYLFKRVIALDAVPELLQANREYNSDRENILYLRFHTGHHDWSIFSMNAIHVVFLDASHDFESVMQDIDNCLRIPTVSLIIFDDYGAEEGVRMAVQRFVSAARLRPVAFLGEGAAGSWRLRDGREVQDREAVACEVLRP
ncbi:unnamed protein product [Effrenium voratum]|uniref:Uncharacterized protein n=1 Tax=Effrenium voratum TaxID=2562239 RepID=A0AA36MHD8_9DINO|nr:unnamed protein product [Effrenium voratum]CAJ1456289.1 unnamed protein product [Effrenium voratum]